MHQSRKALSKNEYICIHMLYSCRNLVVTLNSGNVINEDHDIHLTYKKESVKRYHDIMQYQTISGTFFHVSHGLKPQTVMPHHARCTSH